MHVIVGMVAFVCGVVCAMTSNFTLLQIVDRVNERLPQERQFEFFIWYWSKYQRLFAEYKRLYPDGGLLGKFLISTALVPACFFIGIWGSDSLYSEICVTESWIDQWESLADK